ncbi:MAG: hypothetical protein C0522_13410 [Rhodocyclaceae bacterium]|jgi:outer membrane protein|nr:hypothetical protein [Rhodocyclaceae bacterium]
MNKSATLSLLVGALMAAFSTAGQAADEGQWMVRARAVNLDMANKSEPVGGVGASDRISVSDKTIPEVDISYFLTKNIAAELILTVPQKQDVLLDGAKVGTFKHLPPTLTVQYHFLPDGQFRPYVGAGINYTRISSVNLGGLYLENDSWGPALQAGLDVKLGQNLFLNLDVKKIYIRSDVLAGGTKVSAVKLDPLAVGIGLGWRF